VPRERSQSLSAAAEGLGTTLENLLLAGFASLLSRLTRQDAVTISVGRSEIAHFNVEGECSFRDVVNQGRSENRKPPTTAQANGRYAEQDVHYEFLTDGAAPTANAACGLRLAVNHSGLQLELASPIGLWQEHTLKAWLDYLLVLLNAAADNADLPVNQLPLWDESSARRFYEMLNRTAVEFPGEPSVTALFAAQAKRRPGATAVVSAGRGYTYRELDERSSDLARHLVSVGAEPNRSVAVCMERSVDLLLALLAVLKSGAYYVPLDPHNPSERLRGILEECAPVALLSDNKTAQSLEDSLQLHTQDLGSLPLIRVDQAIGQAIGHSNDRGDQAKTDSPSSLPERINPDDLAYTIYTSGTTGKPKGVSIVQSALLNLICAMGRKPGLKETDRMLAVAPISFDIATMDMFLPICTGGTLVIADRADAVDPFRLSHLLTEHDITCMQATPATWRMLVTSGWQGKKNLKMISGGEALPRELASNLLRLGGELWNCYGPTETTIYSAVLEIKLEAGIVPVGPPMPNTTFYVMDKLGQPLPPGVPGELYIGGKGVSPGYVARPELTAQRFVPDRFGPDPNAQLFCTGDLVRLVNGNEFEFFGRLDHQVKLRGFRIELGEIESVLRSHASITDAVVVLREDIPGEPRLVAYIICPGAQVGAVDLREFVAKTLPEYMLPSLVVALDRFPLSASGKINRRALPVPESVPAQIVADHPEAAAPADELEGKLLKIFREVLRNDAIGVTDSFFRYGGYSLLTVRLFSRIERELRERLPISLLFDAPTVRELARVIRQGAAPSVIVPIRPYGRSAPIFVVQSYLLYSAMLDIVEEDRPIYGVREMANEKAPMSVEERARKFSSEILQIAPTGPVYLAGWCAAGTLTVEIARQLRESGHEVGLVALFDAERPGFALPSGPKNWASRAWTKTRYHFGRLSNIPWGEKFQYLFEAMERNWDWAVESYYTANYRSMLWLQKRFGLSLSEAAYNNVYASLAALNDYSVRPYPGKLNLFRAADVPNFAEMDPTLGWSTIAREGVEVNFVPGDHVSMFKKPHIASLAYRLQQELQKSEGRAVHG
jgi:amino acid adenylation domain-containing protein